MVKLFDSAIGEIHRFIESMDSRRVTLFDSAGAPEWPAGDRKSVVLKSDTGVELGSPEVESASFIVWTEDKSLVREGRITLVGPDIHEAKAGPLPFGKAVIVRVKGFDENNSYPRYREMEMARFDITAEGYMMRAVSQHMREWCRVSRGAVARGFSVAVTGSRLDSALKKLDYVEGVEILYVTSSSEDVRALREIGEAAMRYIHAMNRMEQELRLDCGTCEYNDICSEVEDLRKMRKSLIRESAGDRHRGA